MTKGYEPEGWNATTDWVDLACWAAHTPGLPDPLNRLRISKYPLILGLGVEEGRRRGRGREEGLTFDSAFDASPFFSGPTFSNLPPLALPTRPQISIPTLTSYLHPESPIIQPYLDAINGTVEALPSTKLACIVSFESFFGAEPSQG